jgi:hypothetical protein
MIGETRDTAMTTIHKDKIYQLHGERVDQICKHWAKRQKAIKKIVALKNELERELYAAPNGEEELSNESAIVPRPPALVITNLIKQIAALETDDDIDLVQAFSDRDYEF